MKRGVKMRIVYVDILFFLNLVVDYFLLVLTAKLGGVWQKRRWLALGAAEGAILAVLLYFPTFPVFLKVILQAGVCFCVTMTAFCTAKTGRTWRLFGLFLLLTFVSAGVVFAVSLIGGQSVDVRNGSFYLDIPLPVMAVSFALVYLVSGHVLGKGRAETGRKTYEMRAEHHGRTVQVRLLYDSGNLLRDPITGKRVIVVNQNVCKTLLSMNTEHVLETAEDFLQILQKENETASWLVTAKTAGKTCLLPVFSPDTLWIDGKQTEEYLLGIALNPMDLGGDCSGLIGV